MIVSEIYKKSRLNLKDMESVHRECWNDLEDKNLDVEGNRDRLMEILIGYRDTIRGAPCPFTLYGGSGEAWYVGQDLALKDLKAGNADVAVEEEAAVVDDRDETVQCGIGGGPGY